MRLNAQDASLLILVCVVAFFLGYALLPDDYELNLELKKISIQYSQSSPSSNPPEASDQTIEETENNTTIAATNPVIEHTEPSSITTDFAGTAFMPDKSHQRILFIGDSMLEGLSLRLNDYAAQDNNYLMTVIWYASSTRHWGGTDSLSMLIKKYKPTYIFISCGGNELQTRNIEASRKHIHKIVETFGDIPFVWIGPPNWKPDTGINDAIRDIVGKNRFFDSSHLKLARKDDHIHPTYTAAAYWMDSIANWVSSPQAAHPIQMTYPTVKAQKRNLRVFKRAR